MKGAAGAAAKAAVPRAPRSTRPAAARRIRQATSPRPGVTSEKLAKGAAKGAAAGSRARSGGPAGAARTAYQWAPAAPRSVMYPAAPQSAVVSGASKIIWAVAAFVLVMEGLSYLTGHYFEWNLGGVLSRPLSATPEAYVPLYGGTGSGGS